MSRRLLNNRTGQLLQALVSVAAGVIFCAILTPTPAQAANPLIMGPAYEEPERDDDNPAPPSGDNCAVQIAELTDTRRAPATLGSFASVRAIEAPAERDAWLRSVFEVGLTARGFRPTFLAAGEAPTTDPSIVVVNVRIQAIWITTLQMNKTGSVVFRAAIVSGRVPGVGEIYRGDKISLNMWGSRNEFNSLANDLFAIALDDFAADLRTQCALISAGGAGTSAEEVAP